MWAGWETNTFKLQQAGWQLSAEQDFMHQRMRIAMSHDGMRMMAMSPSIDFEYERSYRDRDYLQHIVLPVQAAVARDLTIHAQGAINWNMQAIDAAPTFMENHQLHRLEDLAHFAVPLVRTQQIIIPEDSVPALLERILKLQAPARTDRAREAQRAPEGMEIGTVPQQRFQAQIISIAA